MLLLGKVYMVAQRRDNEIKSEKLYRYTILHVHVYDAANNQLCVNKREIFANYYIG